MLAMLPKLMTIFRRSLAVREAAQSRTTQSQWQGNGAVFLIVSILVVAASFAFPDAGLDSTEAAGWVVAALVGIVGPTVARVIGKAKVEAEGRLVDAVRGDIPEGVSAVLDRVKLNRARFKGEESWTRVSKGALVAFAEGYFEGVDDDGHVWRLETGEIVGEIRLPKPKTGE